MKVRKERKYFSIFEHEKEQKYLQEKHKEGWKFVLVTGLGTYHFEQCEPEDVVYQLDYNQDGLAHKEEYIQMFEDCGWEYLMDFYGYSYFRKPTSKMKEEEEIFCDENSGTAAIPTIALAICSTLISLGCTISPPVPLLVLPCWYLLRNKTLER